MKNKYDLFLTVFIISFLSIYLTTILETETILKSGKASIQSILLVEAGFPVLSSNLITSASIIPYFMLLMGMGIAGIWSVDLLKDQFKGNFFKWEENNQLLWPHLFAEYLTAFGLIAGSIGILTHQQWGLNLSLIALGALFYTSLNSLSWAFKEKERFGYAVPMVIGLLGSIISFTILLG